MPKAHVVYGLVTLNVVIYVYTSILSGDLLSTSFSVIWAFGQVNSLVMSGCYWQLFTAMFVHANLPHLAFNMVFLLAFGIRAEESLGSATLVLTYFTSGLLGNLFTLFLMDPYGLTVSLGASGAVFGVVGAYVTYLGKAYSSSIIAAIIYSFLLLILNISLGVNVIAHIGGLIAGLVIGYAKARARKPDEEEWR